MEDIEFDIDIGIGPVDAAKAAVAACEAAVVSLANSAKGLGSDWAKDFEAATGASSKAAAGIDTIRKATEKVKAAYASVKAAPGKVADAAKRAFEAVKAAPGKAVDATKAAFASITKVVRSPFTSIARLGGGIKDVAVKGLGALKAAAVKGLPALKSLASKGFDAVKKGASAAAGGLASAGKTALQFAGGAAAAGVAAIAAALVKVGQTTIARDNLRATLDQVTKGRGAEALKQLDKLAKGLNKSTEEVTADFVALRKQGLDNVNSAKLIKLRADLEAVGVDSATAEKAVQKAAAAIKSGQGADAAIKNVAKAYGASGDGANAAAKKAYTLEGALTRIKLMLEQGLAAVADKLGPKLTGLVDKIAKGFENLDSADVEKYFDNIGEAIDALGPVVDFAFKAIGVGIKVALASFQALSSAASWVSAAVTVAAQYIGQAWTAVAPVITSAIDTVSAAYTSVSTTVGNMVTAVTGFVSSFAAAGKALIDGFVKGITDGVSNAVNAAKNAGTAAKDALKSSLGIASPSKVAQAIAGNFVGSFNDTIESAAPANMQAMAPEAPTVPRGGSRANGGASLGNVTVNVYVTQTNATTEDIAIAVETGIRRAVA